MGTKTSAGRAWIATTVCLALLTATIMGCSEPITTYQVSQRCITGTETVLVMPFMDTRTFVDPNDPYKDTLGEHARDIFTAAMRENNAGAQANILTPALPKQTKSLTNGELAELGRAYGADVVVAGQVFSFTDTRAASIPPRAGMFVRLISSRDGSLLFVGDHYQSAAIPGAGGGRDLQARSVSDRLVQGICSAMPPAVARINRVRSDYALASITEGDAEPAPVTPDDADLGFTPLPLSTGDLTAAPSAPMNPAEWDSQVAPELPPITDSLDDFYAMVGADDVVPLPPPSLDEVGMTEEEYAEVLAEVEEVEEAAEMAATTEEPAEVVETPVLAEAVVDDEPAQPEVAAVEEPAAEVVESDDMAEAEQEESTDEMADAPLTSEQFYKQWINSAYPYENLGPVNVADMAYVSGDDMAADLFASESAMLAESLSYRAARNGGETAEVMAAEQAVQPSPVIEDAVAAAEPVVAETLAVAEPYEYLLPQNDGPIISMPLAVEQPRPFRTIDLVLPEDPTATSVSSLAEMSPRLAANQGGIRVLLLPYHDRDNPNNLIPNTGGGEVVTTLYGTQLSQDPAIQVLWDSSGQATHDRLLDKDEAIMMGKMVNADYVVRGQVVEFRRAQSVPSFYSVVISTAVLAAQIFFAEMSGVDVATEVYRVADGACVMSRRDRAQQKYVVQAEKTVRRLAAGMAASVTKVVKQSDPELMDPLIDDITPVNLLGNINLE